MAPFVFCIPIMDVHMLPDPREYARVSPKNHLVQAMLRWQEASGNARDEQEQHVRFLIEQALAVGDDKVLGIALSLLPSAALAARFWKWLAATTVARPQSRVWPLAVPLVVVAAAGVRQTVPGELNEVSSLIDLWRDCGLFPRQANIWLSNRLVSLAEMQTVSPATLYGWTGMPLSAGDGWPQLPAAAPLQVQQEGAWLRFIPGLLLSAEAPAWNTDLRLWGRQAANWATTALARDGVNLLAMPRAPQAVLAALDDGRDAQHAVALQLFVGNALRELREQGHGPAAQLSMHTDHQLQLRIAAADAPAQQFSYRRSVNAFDDLGIIEADIVKLLHECGVESIAIAADLLDPDLPVE